MKSLSASFQHGRLASILFMTASTAATRGGVAAEARPNVLVILADDLGYGDLGCYGATKVKTPNIDQLAREGRRFTDAHSASAVCTPSRYALLTGEYPFRRNLWGPVMNPGPLAIDPAQTTIAGLLKRQGYATACFGKWHLGFGSRPRPDWNRDLKPGPLELGFDYYFGLPVVSSHPPFVLIENHRVLGLDPADPAQTRNVIGEHPAAAAQLKALLGEIQLRPRTAPGRRTPPSP
jgi:arylsulfatase A